jgi:hypothetical protein
MKSQKWVQMQKKRYGQKRKGGFVDMGKQVRHIKNLRCFGAHSGLLRRICLLSTCAKS